MKNFKLFIIVVVFLFISSLTFAQPVIEVSESTVDFGMVMINKGSHIVRNVRVTNNGNIPLEIISATTSSTSKNNPFKLNELKNIIIPAGKYYDIFITNFYEKSAKVGPYNGTLTITHNAKGSPTKVKLLGSAILPPLYTIDPDKELNFGIVKLDSSLQKSIMLFNHSNSPSPIVISSIELLTCKETFTILNNKLPITISPGSYYEVLIKFLPIKGCNGSRLKIIYNVNYEKIIDIVGYIDN